MFNIKKDHNTDKTDPTESYSLLRASLHKWCNRFRKLVFSLNYLFSHNDETIPLGHT